jgi:hypothetical protein
MLLWTIAELMYLTRNELCDLAEQIAFKLPELEAGTVARHDALTSLETFERSCACGIFAREPKPLPVCAGSGDRLTRCHKTGASRLCWS